MITRLVASSLYQGIHSLFQFVAHPNVQQLLASIWYDGLPGFLQMNMVLQFLEVKKAPSIKDVCKFYFGILIIPTHLSHTKRQNNSYDQYDL